MCGETFGAGYWPHFLERESHVKQIILQISMNVNIPYSELYSTLRSGHYIDFNIKNHLNEEDFYQRIHLPLSRFIESRIIIIIN
jgi:hypothetical protein